MKTIYVLIFSAFVFTTELNAQNLQACDNNISVESLGKASLAIYYANKEIHIQEIVRDIDNITIYNAPSNSDINCYFKKLKSAGYQEYDSTENDTYVFVRELNGTIVRSLIICQKGTRNLQIHKYDGIINLKTISQLGKN